MLRVAAMTDKGPIGLVGINDENLIRMQAGMPLDIDIKAITPPGTRINRVIVHYGHTYTDVVQDMAEGGIPVTDQLRELAKDMDERIEKERKERKKG